MFWSRKSSEKGARTRNSARSVVAKRMKLTPNKADSVIKPTPKLAPTTPATFAAVEKAVCVSRDWMNHTSIATTLRAFDAAFVASARIKTACDKEAPEIVKLLCRKGRKEDAEPCLVGLVNHPAGGKKADVALGFLLLFKYASSDRARALIEQIQDRAARCESARRQAYNVLIQSAAAVLACPDEVGRTKWDDRLPASLTSGDASDAMATSASPLALVRSSHDSEAAKACLGDPAALGALSRLLECVEHYLDAHKLSAFKSALHEPARLWYHLIGHAHHRDHVNVHGLNGYLCIVRGALGCQMPLVPLASDGDAFKGCGNHWRGLSDAAWAAFADPANFGKDMEAIMAKGTSGFLAHKHNDDGWCGRNAGALEERAKRGDAALLPHVARFGHFFTDDFLTRRMFETLNGENDPAVAGFRKACDQLWPLYARRLSPRSTIDGDREPASTLVEHVYTDEYFTTLDTQRVGEFFRWAGVYKSK